MHIYSAIRQRVCAVIVRDHLSHWEMKTADGWRRVPAAVAKAYVATRCGLHKHEVPAALAWLFGPAAHRPGKPRQRALLPEPCVDRSAWDEFDWTLYYAVMADWARFNVEKWLETPKPANLSSAALERLFRAECPGRYYQRHLFDEITMI